MASHNSFLPRQTTTTFAPNPIYKELQEVFIENVPAIVKVPNRCKNICKKFVPICTLLMFMFGSALFGFSVITISESEVGYFNEKPCYNDTSVFLDPGVYIEFPWVKSKINIIDIGKKNLTLGKLNDDDTCISIAELIVFDICDFVNSVIKFKSETNLFATLLPTLSFVGRDGTPYLNTTHYGLLFSTIYC
jgi:hypothetical protein